MMKGLIKEMTKELNTAQGSIGQEIYEIKELLKEQNRLLRDYLESD